MAPCSVKHGNIQYCFECPEYPCRYYGTLFERVPVDHVADADLIGVPGYHVEVKRVEKLNINTATEQAKRDAYWKVGQRIVEQEQKGKKRADYGAYIIKRLSQHLGDEFGSGF